jgi:hypothetical protein
VHRVGCRLSPAKLRKLSFEQSARAIGGRNLRVKAPAVFADKFSNRSFDLLFTRSTAPTRREMRLNPAGCSRGQLAVDSQHELLVGNMIVFAQHTIKYQNLSLRSIRATRSPQSRTAPVAS